ncbi:tyrosine-type recombinase/integrase [Isoptericola sp. b490]|uniref:tyrosine-type recombinase/integrase n=1 Tax=Actinotalea lenta TaxID=3064654 RepID=UPI0027124AA4|nr:tyrosine-type recombinase/integrase [Isoptericola sp. b490]MDO8119725.1 tyrosine-type recombinase/integrase [Isoptericola sp. b490]
MAWARSRRREKGVTYTAMYRDPSGRERSAGTFASQRAALRAAQREEARVESGTWFDAAAGKITFRDYVEKVWLPSRHIEVSTMAGYRSYLDKHFLPYFGDLRMYKILPSTVQDWVTQASASGLSPSSIRKYHVMLHSVFKRAVRDRVLASNPCEGTELPKVIAKRTRILTPAECERLLAEVPDRYRLLVMTDIETGLRWGELIALRPRHIDFLRRTFTVEQTIVEVSRKHSPTGERMIVKEYPKDDETRVLRVSQPLLDVIAADIAQRGVGRDDLLFTSTGEADGNPISRNTFRTRVWRPALERSGLDFNVRVHDLRHAHASWLLAGGADLKTVMERMGHSQIMTTQRYLHTLPDAQDKALAAFEAVRFRR